MAFISYELIYVMHAYSCEIRNSHKFITAGREHGKRIPSFQPPRSSCVIPGAATHDVIWASIVRKLPQPSRWLSGFITWLTHKSSIRRKRALKTRCRKTKINCAVKFNSYNKSWVTVALHSAIFGNFSGSDTLYSTWSNLVFQVYITFVWSYRSRAS